MTNIEKFIKLKLEEQAESRMKWERNNKHCIKLKPRQQKSGALTDWTQTTENLVIFFPLMSPDFLLFFNLIWL